ncbi:ARM repeat-containing protein [Gonapodya prolifera JEL478]|uniref:ARM repeat-containing protein n=1 Tax=Gonapodya prolifera (strain JEL478) TaxID=1344416 RepID=A0A139ARA7_GONPJ|nr:ARM repeat-containing protein [Gonapodya prolifera JEL478]|eukprot:KXS19184.1 ARM repeat-containing protein [Gonapodya prolifera JEL478]
MAASPASPEDADDEAIEESFACSDEESSDGTEQETASSDDDGDTCSNESTDTRSERTGTSSFENSDEARVEIENGGVQPGPHAGSGRTAQTPLKSTTVEDGGDHSECGSDSFPEYQSPSGTFPSEQISLMVPSEEVGNTSSSRGLHTPSLPLPPIPHSPKVLSDNSSNSTSTVSPSILSPRSSFGTPKGHHSKIPSLSNPSPIPPEPSRTEPPVRSPTPLGRMARPGSSTDAPLCQNFTWSSYLQRQGRMTLAFGFLPWKLLDDLSDTYSWKVRASAVESLHRHATALADPEVLVSTLPDFLQFSQTLIRDQNFKIALTALHVLRDLLPRLPSDAVNYNLPGVVETLTVTLGDPKAVIRQTTARCIVGLMHHCGAKEVVACCMQLLSPYNAASTLDGPLSLRPLRSMATTTRASCSTSHRPETPTSIASVSARHTPPPEPSSRFPLSTADNPRLREGLVNMACTALLTFPPRTIDLPSLLADLLHALRDTRSRVSTAARECVAVAARTLGPERCLRMLREYGLEAVPLAAVANRLEDSTFARLNSEGLVEHLSLSTTRPSSSVDGEVESSGFQYHYSHHISAPATAAPAHRGDGRCTSPNNDGDDLWSSRGIGVKSAPANRMGEGDLSTSRTYSEREVVSKGSGGINGRAPWASEERRRFLSGSYGAQLNMHPRRLSGKLPWDNRNPPPSPPLVESTIRKRSDSPEVEKSERSDVNATVPAGVDEVGFETRNRSLVVAGKGVGGVTFSNPSSSPDTTRGNKNDRGSYERVNVQHTRPASSNPTNSWDDVVVGGSRKPVPVAELPPLPQWTDNTSTALAFSPSFRQKVAMRSQAGRDKPAASSHEGLEVTGSSEAVGGGAKNERRSDSPVPPEAPKMKSSSPRRNGAGSVRKIGEPTVRSISPDRFAVKLSSKPEQDIVRAVQVLKSGQDWDFKCRALEAISAVLRDHPDLFITALHDHTLTIVAEVSNLRSTVSKCAIAVVAEMFSNLGKSMDAELEVVVGALLKKVGENSSFLVEVVDRALGAMMERATPSRAVAALCNSFDHKNAVIKAKAATCIERILCSMGEPQLTKYIIGQYDMDKLLPALVALSKEGLGETRNAAKRTLAHLAKAQEFERVLDKVLSAGSAREAREAIKWAQGKGGERMGLVPAKLNAPIASSKQETRHIARSPDVEAHVMDFLPAVFFAVSSNDARTRFEAIPSLVDTVERHGSNFSPAEAATLFDHLADRCRDGNAKVALAALQAVAKVTPALKHLVDPSVSTLTPVLLAASVSSVPSSRAAGGHALSALAASVSDAGPLSQAVAAVVQFNGNAKMRAGAGECLATLSSTLHSKSPRSFFRHALPALVSLVSADRPEARASGGKLARALAECVGRQQLVEGLVAGGWPEVAGKVKGLLGA